jgi:hypothetical protein
MASANLFVSILVLRDPWDASSSGRIRAATHRCVKLDASSSGRIRAATHRWEKEKGGLSHYFRES